MYWQQFIPLGKEGLCPDEHHGVLRMWYALWSVLRRNRGEKMLSEKDLSVKDLSEHPRRTKHLCLREVAPDTPTEV